jgi:hypothetical protein
MAQYVFVPGNVPSMKDYKIARQKGMYMSKRVRRYLSSLGVSKFGRNGVVEMKTIPPLFRDLLFDLDFVGSGPLRIGFHFVRNSRHKFDFHNAVHILSDLMAAYGFIHDDSCDYFVPYPVPLSSIRDGMFHLCAEEAGCYTYDKENPGVYIMIF